MVIVLCVSIGFVVNWSTFFIVVISIYEYVLCTCSVVRTFCLILDMDPPRKSGGCKVRISKFGLFHS